jgi:NAD(P)-dependent dehydrogenase (short-subunit alcohol dehydrogenase family)
VEPQETEALSTVNIAEFQETFAVDTFGSLLLTQAFLPYILASPNSHIVVMFSRVGSMAGVAYSYRSSKAAVNALFTAMAVNWKEKGVPVIILHPGIISHGIL